MAILLTFLFSFFVQSAKIETKLDNVRMHVSKRGYLQTRLQSVLTSIDRGSLDPYFYTKQFDKEKNPSLILLFDNGIDPDPAFSGTILARIYLDEKKNLNLTTWPLNKKKDISWRNEILLSNVSDFEFEFLGKISASEHGRQEKIRPITATLAWRTLWPKSERTIPGIVRLTVYEEGVKEPVQYAFILPESEPFVTYREKAAML